MTRGERLNSIIDSIAAAGFDLKGMRGTLLGALNDAVEVGLCENGRKVHKERRDGGNLADAVGRYIDKGCNDEEGLRAALTRWVDSGDRDECVHQVGQKRKPLELQTREDNAEIPEGMAVIFMRDGGWLGSNNGYPTGQPALYRLDVAEQLVALWNDSQSVAGKKP